MFDARRVQTLYTRRRRLNLALADMGRRADRIRKSIVEVEDELRTMVLFLRPLKPRQPKVVLGRELLEFLREAETPPTTREAALWIMRREGLHYPDPREYRLFQNRVWATLDGLRAGGLAERVGESRRVVRWRLWID